MKRNGYCGGMVGLNGAKTRAHVTSLPCYLFLGFTYKEERKENKDVSATYGMDQKKDYENPS